jgi:hypothetical protein
LKERHVSTSVAPLPTGGGVTVIAEHRGRREQDGRADAEPEHAGDESAPAEPVAVPPLVAAPPPPPDEELVPAATLFEATLLANSLPRTLPTADELRLRQGQGWVPPDSSLRLKDKLI